MKNPWKEINTQATIQGSKVYSDGPSLYHGKLGNICSQKFSKNFRMINFHMVQMCMKIFKYKYLLTHVQVVVHIYVCTINGNQCTLSFCTERLLT